MKRFITLLTLALFISVAALAQRGLHISKLFTSLRGNTDVAIVCVQGSALKPYKLTLFHSITVEDNQQLTRLIEDALAKDARKAVDREVHYKDGRLSYAFFNLGPGADDLNRYILFTGGRRTVLLYLEGKAKPDIINSFLQ